MNILESLVSAADIPASDFQNIGIALLTVLVPLGIAVLSEFLRKVDERKEYADLDLHVILDEVLQYHLLLFAIFLIFTPFIFWSWVSVSTRYWILLSWGIGVWQVVRILINCYSWVKGNRFGLRLRYFRNLNPGEDLIVTSRSIWSSKGLNIEEERKFFGEFLSHTKSLTNYDE